MAQRNSLNSSRGLTERIVERLDRLADQREMTLDTTDAPPDFPELDRAIARGARALADMVSVKADVIQYMRRRRSNPWN